MGGAHRLEASRITVQRTSSDGLALAFSEAKDSHNVSQNYRLSVRRWSETDI